MIKQLKPVEVVRDSYGEFVHPEYQKYWYDNFDGADRITKEQSNNLLNDLNVEIKTTKLEDDTSVSEEILEEIMESCNLSKWTPETPEGYFVVGYWFNEDSAVAVFAKEKHHEN